MNSPSEIISYISYALLPLYIVYLIFNSSSVEDKCARQVVKNRQHFIKCRAKMRAWRVAVLYETYQNDFALSPKLHYSIEVNTGWFFAPRWKYIMVAPASSSKEMMEKFRKAELGRLPKNLQTDDYVHVPGQAKAWKIGFFFIAAFPFAIEVLRVLAFR